MFVHLFDETFTDQATGSASASYSNSLWGADLNYRLHTPLLRERGFNVDVTAGLRYVNLTETLSISSLVNSSRVDATVFEPALGIAGTPNFTNTIQTTTATTDAIKTRNNFIGPQIGARLDYRWDERWSTTGEARLALGANIETLSVSGSNVSTVTATTSPTSNILLAGIPLTIGTGAAPTTTTTTSSSGTGVLANPANSGNRTRTVFAFIPGGNFKLNYDVLPNFLTLSLGYNVFWISDVLRASNQIGGGGQPTFEQSGILAQGVTLSAKMKF